MNKIHYKESVSFVFLLDVVLFHSLLLENNLREGFVT